MKGEGEEERQSFELIKQAKSTFNTAVVTVRHGCNLALANVIAACLERLPL